MNTTTSIKTITITTTTTMIIIILLTIIIIIIITRCYILKQMWKGSTSQEKMEAGV